MFILYDTINVYAPSFQNCCVLLKFHVDKSFVDLMDSVSILKIRVSRWAQPPSPHAPPALMGLRPIVDTVARFLLFSLKEGIVKLFLKKHITFFYNFRFLPSLPLYINSFSNNYCIIYKPSRERTWCNEKILQKTIKNAIMKQT